MLSMYPACFLREENGYSVIFPDLNWLATQGDTLEEAMSMAVDCLAGYLYTCRLDKDPVPAPSRAADIDPAAMAREIGSDIQGSDVFVNVVSVDVDAYAKQHFERSVKKTLTIPAWLNKAALEKHINFSQVLQEALVQKLQALK